MSTATALQRIKRGLAASGHKSSFQSLESVVGCPLTFDDLNTTVHTIINKRDALRNQAEALTKRLAAFEASTRAELAETGIVREENPAGGYRISDLWGPDKRKIELERRVSAKRQELTAQIEESRAASMAAIKDAIAKIETVRNLWTDAPAFLGRNVVGESSLRIYKQNLEGTPPKQIENILKQAVARGDRVMVAACLDILDGMAPEDAKQVNIDRHEAAALALGEDYIKARHFIAAADLAVLNAQLADAQIEGKDTSRLLVRIGLKDRECRAWGGEDFDPEEVEKQIEGGTNEPA